VHEIEPFWYQLPSKEIHSGDIAIWPVEASDKSGSHRIGAEQTTGCARMVVSCCNRARHLLEQKENHKTRLFARLREKNYILDTVH